MDIQDILGEKIFASIEEMNDFVKQVMDEQNNAGLEEFQGLNSEQMFNFLYHPFEAKQFVSFPEHVDNVTDAPIMQLFIMLVEAIGETGLKATAKGNLPQKFCRESALRYWGERRYERNTRFGGINKEEDFSDMHVMRINAMKAKIIGLNKGKFVIKPKYRKQVAAADYSTIYPQLFKTFATIYNWGFTDRYPEFCIIQQSFVFTLYLLEKYGKTERPNSFYEAFFIKAFPFEDDDCEGMSFIGEQDFKSCYISRSLKRFARFMGLAKVENMEFDNPISRNYKISNLPLLKNVVCFNH